MSCIHKDLRLEVHVRGTTWGGLSLIFSNKHDDGTKTPVDLTGWQITATVKKNAVGITIFELSTQAGTIVLDETVTGKFIFLPRLITLSEYDYYITIKAVSPDGTVHPVANLYWPIIN